MSRRSVEPHRSRAPTKQNARTSRAFDVPRGTSADHRRSGITTWRHVSLAGLADQRRGVGVAQLQDDVLVAQRGQGIQQVVHVEADRQAVDPGVGFDFFLRFFLLRVVRD